MAGESTRPPLSTSLRPGELPLHTRSQRTSLYSVSGSMASICRSFPYPSLFTNQCLSCPTISYNSLPTLQATGEGSRSGDIVSPVVQGGPDSGHAPAGPGRGTLPATGLSLCLHQRSALGREILPQGQYGSGIVDRIKLQSANPSYED